MMKLCVLNVCYHCSVVKAFEKIISAVVQRENFTGIIIREENIAIRIEQVRELNL